MSVVLSNAAAIAAKYYDMPCCAYPRYMAVINPNSNRDPGCEMKFRAREPLRCTRLPPQAFRRSTPSKGTGTNPTRYRLPSILYRRAYIYVA